MTWNPTFGWPLPQQTPITPINANSTISIVKLANPLTRDPLTRDPLTRDPLTRDPLTRESPCAQSRLTRKRR